MSVVTAKSEAECIAVQVVDAVSYRPSPKRRKAAIELCAQLIDEAFKSRCTGWFTMETAPKDGNCFLAVVNGDVRQVTWGKTSHVPLYGWIYADQGEETDLCTPALWMPMPIAPTDTARASQPQGPQR